MKKRRKSRRIFKILIFIAVYMIVITALLPKSAVAETVKTVKSSKAVTDVKIIYDASYRTKDYTCWSGGYSIWTGTAYNNLNTVKNAGVVRRGTTFTFTGTGATASTVIEVRGPTDSGSRPVVTGWNPTYAGGENWQLTIPNDAPVGDYQIYMDSEYCTLYVIFDVFETKTPSGMTDNQFAGWAYDEASTADNYIPVLDNTKIATLNPFTERATEMAVSVLGGNTTTTYEAGIKMYRVTNSRITWDGGTTIPSLTEMLDQATALPVWEAKNVSLQTGYTLPSGMVLATGYQCTHFAYVTAGLARSLGIPSRGIHCKTIWEWNYHEWAELYIDNPGTTLADGDSKWLVFDATDQNHNNGHDSAGESSIDTEKGYYYHSIKLSGTPATGSDGPQAREWKGSGAGGATADWADINLDTAYTCTDGDIPTISLSETAEGDMGEGDRDFFRINVSSVSTVDVVLAEGKEYAWLYVRKDAPVTASATPGVKSNYVADANDTDAIIGLDVSTANYLYVMVDNCKGNIEFQDNYWVGGRSETHHWVVGIGPGPYVKVNNPNGNETLVAGSSYIIEWEAVDVYDTSNSGALNINITYSTNSGLSYDYTIATNEANDGSYTWYIPNIESTNVRIKVTADDGAKTNNDTSDNDFTVKPPDPLNEIVSGTGAFSGDWFGYSVSNLGDINGDGYNDTIVGAPYNDFNGQDAGAVYIFFGRTTWSAGNLNADSANVKIYGNVANDHFGWSVSSAGNVNGDLYNDIVIGAPGNTTTVAGSAYIFYGRGTWNPTYNANNADVILNGGSNGDRFGFSVSDAGNVNNADNDDIIIGAPYNDSADGRWMDCGAAYVFYGDPGLTGTMSVTSADVNLTGATIYDYFGFSVSGAGDVNGNGYDDVIVGAPGADSAYIFYGSATMGSDFGVLGIKTYGYTGVTTAGPHDAYACDVDVFPFAGDAANRNTMVEATNAQYTAISASDNSRWTTVDPGALDEIFMWFEINGITQKPAKITQIDFTFEGYSAIASDMQIYVMKAGADWTLDASWVQVGSTVNFAAGADSTMTVSLTSGFSTYIDGTGKLVWGVYQVVSSEALNVDYVKVDIKTECKANITLTGESTTNFGFSVSSVRDVNSDGFDDIVVGAPNYNNDQGRAYIFYGNTVMTTDPYVSETILFEDFDEGGAVPSGWDVSDWTGPAVAAQWHTTNDNARYGAIVSGTDYGMVSDSDQAGSGAMDAWLKSPGMDCSVYDKVQLQFAHVFNWISGYGVDTIYVYVATDGSVDSADYLVYSFTDADIALETKTFDISGYAAHQSNVKIGFRYTANYDMWWIIDDVFLIGKKPSSTTFITGEMPGDKFGFSVARAGDINNDGINDTVIGAPYNDRTTSDAGAVYILYGNSSMSRSMCAGAADKINYGETANDNFGFSVSGLGDVNNDNYDDVGVGAPNTSNGKAYVYSTQGGAAPDTEKPQISNVDDSPDPQEAGGYVNITAVVTDNVGVSSVKVNISGPAGFTPVNVSMIKVSGTDTYYYNISYSLLGTYTYFVWAADASNNGNTSTTYTFVIQDTIKPEITNVQDTPDPQEVNGRVNITVTVTDALLDKVKVNISGPAGFIPVNTTMTKVSGTDNYYYNTTYTVKGAYSYFIWANDTSNNGNISSSNTFTIQDTTKPEISSVQASPESQTSGGYVNISVIVTDNVDVSEVWLNISWNNGNSWTNFSI
ncbi:MAG: transglutaminase domain-containing protein, partial [Thermoplasmatales archaeon]|nr:transglutaminase domain-containing protein [Thermoplasmatales archaeon]